MAVSLTFADYPGAALRGPDQWDWLSIHDNGPIEQMFSSYPESAPAQFDKAQDAFFVHAISQRIWLIRKGVVKHIAGIRNVVGDRDGPGLQALFALGGFYGVVVSLTHNSAGEVFVTDAQNKKIRKLTERPDGSWIVATFLTGINSDSIACDSRDNLWIVPNFSAELYKYDRSGKLLNRFPVPSVNGSWGGLVADKVGGLWTCLIEGGPATSLWRVDVATGAFEHKAALRYAGWRSYQDRGVPVPVDGPILNCSLFKANLGYLSPDGKVAIFGGGDETQARKIDFNTGRCTSLDKDGQWRELQDRRAGFYVGQPLRPDENGYPVSYVFPWIPGLRTFYRKIALVETHQSNDAAFVSQTVPKQMIAGRQYKCTIVMRNSGDTTWTEGAKYRLGSQNPQDNTTWAVARSLLPDGVRVPPKTNTSFTFSVTAPGTAGIYNFQWRMVRETVQWFGAYTENVPVKVVSEAGT